MDYRIYLNQDFNSLKDLEKFLASQEALLPSENPEWEEVEETAIAFVQGSFSDIFYFSMPEGTKMGAFSYRKVNQAICVVYDKESKGKLEHFYFRILRRLKSASNRVKFLAANESEVKNELIQLLNRPEKQFNAIERVQFSFHLQHRDEMDDFLNLCRENHVKNLEYVNTFPVDLEEKGGLGSFVNKEVFLFMGELESKDLNIFISGLMESGFKLDKLTYQPVFKVK